VSLAEDAVKKRLVKVGFMPKVTEQHRVARQDEIIEAALGVFRRKGFQATSMAEIIASSGLSAGAIYGYFSSKTEIVYAAATRIVPARVDELDAMARREPMPVPAVMIRTLLEGMVSNLGAPAILLQVWGEAATDPVLRELCSGIMTALQAAITRYLTRWQQSSHGLNEELAERIAHEQAPLYVAAVNGFIVQDSIAGNFDRERYLARTLPHLPQ